MRERRACRFGTGCAQSVGYWRSSRVYNSFIQLLSCQQFTLLPLERSLGLRRQAAAEHPLANTPLAAERGAARQASAKNPLANTPWAERGGLRRQAAAEHPLANTP